MKKHLFTAFLTLSLALTNILSLSAEDGKLVKAIDVRGNKTVSSLTVLAKVKTQIGQTSNSSVLNEDLKRLYSIGYFTDVRVEQEDFEDGTRVIFIVIEKPILSDIKIEGARQIKADQIKKEMKSVVGDFVDQRKVKEDIEAVKKFYEKKGFSEIDVESSLDIDPDNNQGILRVMINEGGKVRVKQIRVEGNTALKTKDIIGKMKTKAYSWWGWVSSGYLKEDEMEEDVERVKAYYDENGFSDAEVEMDVEPIGDANNGDVSLIVSVEEGKQYLVGDINIKGNSILTLEQIQKALLMSSSKPFSRRNLRVDVSNIQDLYFEQGYLSANIRSESIYNEATGRVDVSYSITENELTYVDKVKIQGNAKTKDIVIRRELRAYPGEPFTGAKLKRSKERLYNLGYFEDVRFDTEEGSQPNSRDLVVSVKEAKTGEFSFGGGYSSIDSVIGFAQIRQKNFDWQNYPSFTGAGQDFSTRIELGSVRKNAEISFTEPWAFGHPYSLGFDLYRREFSRSGSAGYFYDLERLGGDIRLGKEFSEYDKALLMYKLEEVKISDIPDDSSSLLRDELGKNVTSSLALTLTHDERDNIYNPSKGYYVSGTGEFAGGLLAGDKDFWKLDGVAATYYKNFDVNVLEFKIRGGLADSFDNTPRVPIYERYFAGGANTIRGYRERRVGPRDPGNNSPIGGEAYWVFNVEETIPVVPNLLKAAAFYDVGAVYDDESLNGSDDIVSGVGVGVRVKTPIGPVKLDMGYPLDDIEGEKKKVRFYFNISQAF